jgi:myo-inositol-1(or 4)-monophosphatase
MPDGGKYMEIKDSEHFEELRTAFQAAEEAGEIIDKFFRNGFEDWEKDDGSAVTEADLRSQEKIVEIISEKFPEDVLLGEEEHLEPEGEERVWVIDPLDGTLNFEKDWPHFCVSIALEIDGEAVVGVVYSPESVLEKSYFAIKDEVAFVTDKGLEEAEEISVSDHEKIEDSLFFLTSFEMYEGEFEREKQMFEEFAYGQGVQRQLGSCALEMCRLAEGQVDFLVNIVCKHVDFAAGRLIVKEAGGEVRAERHEEFRFFDLVASNGVLQEEVEEVLEGSR